MTLKEVDEELDSQRPQPVTELPADQSARKVTTLAEQAVFPSRPLFNFSIFESFK